jgi:syntaxin-binding protein 1
VCESAGCVLARTLTISPRDESNSLYAWVQGPGDKDLKRRIKQKQSNEEEYELSRYKPLLRTVIEVRVSFCLPVFPAHSQTHTLQDQVAGKLDPAAFPYVKDYPQAAPAAYSAQTNTNTNDFPAQREAKLAPRCAYWRNAVAETRQRVLVFVAGGMTYSEMREAYVLSSQLGKDVIIGACAHSTKSSSLFVD